jgi:hypothetical protein
VCVCICKRERERQRDSFISLSHLRYFVEVAEEEEE